MTAKLQNFSEVKRKNTCYMLRIHQNCELKTKHRSMKPIIIHLLEAFHQIDSSPYMFTLCIKFEIQSLKNLEHGFLNIMYKVYM